MNNKLHTMALIGGMAAAGSSIGCRSEVIYPESYNLDFEKTTIPCGSIELSTPYDQEYYCEDQADDDVVTLDAFYDTSVETRKNITNAVRCVLGPLGFVRVEMQSDDPDAVLAHIGGFARVSTGGKGTYDEGNSNKMQDYIYIADRSNHISPTKTVYFKPDMLALIALHEMGHTLGLVHGSADSIMAAVINHDVEYPFHFTREEAKTLLANTNDQLNEEKIEGLTKADERCQEELSAVKAE